MTDDEMLWVSVDMLALAIPAAEADPESFAENMAASGPSPRGDRGHVESGASRRRAGA